MVVRKRPGQCAAVYKTPPQGQFFKSISQFFLTAFSLFGDQMKLNLHDIILTNLSNLRPIKLNAAHWPCIVTSYPVFAALDSQQNEIYIYIKRLAYCHTL